MIIAAVPSDTELPLQTPKVDLSNSSDSRSAERAEWTVVERAGDRNSEKTCDGSDDCDGAFAICDVSKEALMARTLLAGLLTILHICYVPKNATITFEIVRGFGKLVSRHALDI